MKKLSFILLFALLATLDGLAQQAKYVFFFIGDGMGVNQVQLAELYRGELEGKIGLVPLAFAQYPVCSMATTFSATNGVTDSAAGGTALATACKTKNGTIGMLQDQKTPANSVAVWAKESGARVGVATSVSVDHATPASFYAHRPSRKQYYDIGRDLYAAGFDFYAGSDFLNPDDDGRGDNLYSMAEPNGYAIARGYKDYLKKCKSAEKMILLQTWKASEVYRNAIPYAIDRKKGDMTLSEITRAAINFLSKDLDKGFFLMVEGGKIDWACHSNDAATVIHEVIDLDEAVKVAFEFYSQHPDETLIVITADHETGGVGLGTGPYALNLQVLKNQKVSEVGFTTLVNGLREKYKNQVPWEVLKQALTENFGFWDKVELDENQEARLLAVYESSFKGQEVKMEKSEYSQDEPIAAEAKRIINEIALVGWISGDHSAGFVPVFAIGAGSELFNGRMDNIEIPERIAKAAGYK